MVRDHDCCICADRPAEANGRCHRCRVYLARYGWDRPIDVVVKRRGKPKPVGSGDIAEPFDDPKDAGTTTFGDWCRETGYVPEKREYVEA